MKKVIEKLFLFMVTYITITVLTWAAIYVIMNILKFFSFDLFYLVEQDSASRVLFIFFVATFILTIQFYKELNKSI